MTYADRPWLALYDPGLPTEIEAEFDTALDMFKSAVERAGGRPMLHYFEQSLSGREVDALSDAFAVGLRELGVRKGDRVAVYLQNVPQFVLTMIGTWKAGATMVSVNPMLRHKELRFLLADSGAKVLVSLESLYEEVAREVVPETPVEHVVTTSELEFLGDSRPALLEGSERRRPSGTRDFMELVRRHEGSRPEPARLRPDDVAFLTYTSGTTGPPKGAMNTHHNVVFNSRTFREWLFLSPEDSVLGVAPLFHITGLVAHITVALLVPMPLILFYRFDPDVACEMIDHHRPTYTVGSITVFIALMNCNSADQRDLSSLTKVYSGGAPVAPATVDEFEKKFGAYIHNIYGLTEVTSPSHAVPMNRRAPVDQSSGAISVGIPIFNTMVRIADDEGKDVPVGEVGEVVIKGPGVVPGYWEKPEESAKAIRDGEMFTGDVGFMDSEGWFYIVDRKKDLINAAGYKVWPREVEDVLYAHPAVREAAVVGVSDPYRGETVKAYVSAKKGQTIDTDELLAFCKKRMAAYKRPRVVELMEELPKTPTGKILRRELRSRG